MPTSFCSDGHKKGMLSMGKPVEPELAFTVVTERGSLDLEAPSTEVKEAWIKALQALLKVFRENPASLRS